MKPVVETMDDVWKATLRMVCEKGVEALYSNSVTTAIDEITTMINARSSESPATSRRRPVKSL